MMPRMHPVWLLIIAVILFRLVTLAMYPLIDTTEARYGEIARLMVETNNWLTPQYDYDLPFWGKPPLHTWISAAFGKLFGISEFMLRLPHLITSLLVLVVLGNFAKRLQVSVKNVTLVLVTSLGFISASGMVMTDALLLLSITMALCGFFVAFNYASKSYAYMGFVGIGIGLLAKGPIVLILIGLTIIPWLILNYGVIDGFKNVYKRLPIFTGLGLTCFIALPWYILAERATPGFLNYFLVGEHFLRFVQSGWEGDLYGTAHSEARGKIWLYWFAVAFPWSFYLIALFVSKNSRNKLLTKRVETANQDNLASFLMCWLFCPMILFTFSGNILPIYVLPSIPAVAMLVGRMQTQLNLKLILTSILTPLICITYMIFYLPAISINKSDKLLLANIDQNNPLYIIGKRSFSSRFYTQGKSIEVDSFESLNTLQKPLYVVITKPDSLNSIVVTNCEYISENSRKTLLLCKD